MLDVSATNDGAHWVPYNTPSRSESFHFYFTVFGSQAWAYCMPVTILAPLQMAQQGNEDQYHPGMILTSLHKTCYTYTLLIASTRGNPWYYAMITIHITVILQ